MERMKPPPKVSVCIPTYNYADYLPFAIESVLGQSFTDFELIIQDDCSKDNTAEVVERYLSDRRLIFETNECKPGPCRQLEPLPLQGERGIHQVRFCRRSACITGLSGQNVFSPGPRPIGFPCYFGAKYYRFGIPSCACAF